MSSIFRRPWASLAAMTVVAGCAHSPPTRFFTLDPVPPSGQAVARPAIAPVQLRAVRIPATLDRPQVVTQEGPNRVEVHDLDQWASPLGEMMRQTLAQDLLARLPQGSFILPDAPRPAGVRALVIDVLQLQAGSDGRVVLQASWTLTPAGSAQASLIRDVRLTADAAPGPQGSAAATSRLLGQLADSIAQALPAA